MPRLRAMLSLTALSLAVMLGGCVAYPAYPSYGYGYPAYGYPAYGYGYGAPYYGGVYGGFGGGGWRR